MALDYSASIDETAKRLDEVSARLRQSQYRVTALKQVMHGIDSKVGALQKEHAVAVQAQGLIDKATQVVASKGIGRIESICTKGLQIVFGPCVSLVVSKSEGVAGTNYQIEIHKDTKEGSVAGDPFETFGGGVVNVASFLLRVAMIQRFKLAKFLLLDESFNNVSDSELPRVSQMVQVLCREYGYKVLAVTHQRILAHAADNIYHVTSGEDGPILTCVDALPESL